MFKSKHQDTTKYFNQNRDNKICSTTQPQRFLQHISVDTVFKVQAKKCYSFSFFGYSFRGTHSYVLFYFPVGHIFKFITANSKQFYFSAAVFGWTKNNEKIVAKMAQACNIGFGNSRADVHIISFSTTISSSPG